jgi:hypothetical protein
MKSGNTSKAASKQARIDAALKQAAAHARKQLAAQGLRQPGQIPRTIDSSSEAGSKLPIPPQANDQPLRGPRQGDDAACKNGQIVERSTPVPTGMACLTPRSTSRGAA